MSFQFDVQKPMPVIPYPDLSKIGACVEFLVFREPLSEQRIHAAFFLASSSHAHDYGRPVTGDTWVRGIGLCGVFGIVLSAVLGKRPEKPNLCRVEENRVSLSEEGRSEAVVQASRYIISKSDEEYMSAALDAMHDKTDNEIIEIVHSARLYGSGDTGTLIDWMSALPDSQEQDDETRSDYMYGLIFGKF